MTSFASTATLRRLHPCSRAAAHLRARPRRAGRAQRSGETASVLDRAGAGRSRARKSSLAVGTPPGEDGSADLSYVLAVARDLARAMSGYTVVVTKSTVPVGTAAGLREVIADETSQPFSVVSNPEFLKQGAAIDDFMRPIAS